MNKPELARAFVAGNNGTCHNAMTDGQTYRLHGHAIAVKTDGAVIFYWHEYWTVTTASHMNEVLKALGAPFRVSRSTAAKEGQTHFVYNPTHCVGPKD